MALFRTLEQKHRDELDDAAPERPWLGARLRSAGSLPPVSGWRWVAGTLVMLLAAVYVSASINNAGELGDWWGMSIGQLVTPWLAGFAAGCIVRRWLAVLLALLPILIAIPFGEREDGGGWILDPEPVAYDMLWLAPVCAACIAAGVAAAALAHALRRRASAPAPG